MKTELPVDFKKSSRELFQTESEYESFICAMEEGEAVRSLRVNTLKASVEDFAKRYAEGYSLSSLGYGGGFSFSCEYIGSDPLHHAGAFYVQDPGAMATVAAAEEYIRPDFKVLDMCSAPGGKSTQLAALLTGNDCVLVSNEINFKRASILRSNTERMGHRRTVVTSAPPKKLCRDFSSYFDFVLVDAPCSGEGMMRKYEEAREEWSLENVEMCADRQKEILESAEKCVAPGGYLLYSTCTFNLSENENVVDWFLKTYPEYEMKPLSNEVTACTAQGINFEGCCHDMSLCRRFYPHISRGEGQFLCLMQKNDDGKGEKPTCKSALKPLSVADKKAVAKLLDECLDSYGTPMLLRDTVMLSSDLPCPDYALCCGVAAGELTKGRLVPHHHLFSAYGNSFKQKVDLTPDEALKYIAGETLQVEGCSNGWTAVCVGGSPIGGGKVVDGILKNHYPKGLRQRR